MVSLPCFKCRFTPDWRMTIIAFLVFVLFMRLGFWQLDRAKEKKGMVVEQSRLAEQGPDSWKPGMANPKQYEPLTINGRYLHEQFFLDNQHYQHQFGYDVIIPCQLSSGEVLLIDQGWVAGEPTRQSLPQVSIPDGLQSLSGYAYYSSDKNWVLGQDFEKRGDKLTIIERVDTKLVSQLLHKSVYPFIIRLHKDNAQPYVRDWAIVAMPPERHYAYALQWFAMAAVILILFITLNLKKKHDND